MPNVAYTNFTTGLAQDDFLPATPSFLDWKNVDGIDTGYGLKLWPKVNKQLLTNYPIVAIEGNENVDWWLVETIAGWINGEVYRLDGTDLTPIYTFPNNEDILQIVSTNSEFYIFYRDNDSANEVNIANISAWDIVDNDWSWITLDYFDDVSNISVSKKNLPYLKISQQEIILWGSFWSVHKVNLVAQDSDTYNFPSNVVVWVTAQWSVFMVYCRDWNVYMWDWASELSSGQRYLWARISKVTQKEAIDYISTEDGQLYVGSGLSFQRITKPRMSNRLEDNSSFQSILSFNATEETQNHSMVAVLDDLYLFTPDNVSGLVKYGRIIPWTQEWFHKAICSNYAWEDIDIIYDMYFYERTLQRLYFSYKAGATYGIDYIDFKSVERAPSWYIITDVYTWWDTFKKEIKMIRRATSNTSWDNSITVYYRVDNGDWKLIQTINDAVDKIQVWEPMKTADWETFKRYRDRQYKIVLTNGNGGDNTPILHELNEIFDNDNKNG